MLVHAIRSASPAPMGSIHIARIVEVCDGQAVVAFGGRRVRARSACVAMPRDGGGWVDREVLVVLEGDDPELPVIVGLVTDRLPDAPDCVVLDAPRIRLEGHQEVVLRCGEASITLRADGHVLLKGIRVTSRAAESNKIRGATVAIN